jgi:hypothetical protein
MSGDAQPRGAVGTAAVETFLARREPAQATFDSLGQSRRIQYILRQACKDPALYEGCSLPMSLRTRPSFNMTF